MIIRAEKPKDYPAIRSVNEAAFDTPAEANLVDTLRKVMNPVISLVAEENGTVVGHIMFSPVTLSNNVGIKIMGLAPMAVLPNRQRKGIGSRLVRTGLARCKELGYGAVVVLGHAGYYPRFGFVPASQYGIRSEYDVPDDVFMAMELEPNYLHGVTGTIHYHPAFENV